MSAALLNTESTQQSSLAIAFGVCEAIEAQPSWALGALGLSCTEGCF